jgi:hypothetical protein
MEVASQHIEKMTADIGALDKFTEQIASIAAVIILSFTWLKHYENYIHTLLFTGFFSAAAYFLRKKIFTGIIYLIIFFLKKKMMFLK